MLRVETRGKKGNTVNKACIHEEVAPMGDWKYHMDILGSSANTGLTDISSHSEDTNLSSSRVLAWRIPGTAEPGGLPSMGSHRVGHD